MSGTNGRGKTISTAVAERFAADDPYRATKAFLQEHHDLFGHGAEVLNNAKIKREFVTAHNGLKTVVWEQELDGIPVFEAILVSHTTRKGELVNISSEFLPDIGTAVNRGLPNHASAIASPRITAGRAALIAARNIEIAVDEADITQENNVSPKGPENHQFFNSAKFAGKAEAKLVWLPVSRDEMQLCWDVILTSRERGEMYRVLVNVQTGEPLVRHCLTDYISEASYRVYTSDSPSPFSPGYSTPVSDQPPLTNRVLVTFSALDTNASPWGWIGDGGNETLGNNVDAHTDWNADNVADLPRPHGSPARVFDFPLDLTQAPNTYSNAAIVQLFYWCNFMHDKLYQLGFTEAAGNFQSNNFGRGGLGNDAVQADAQDGSGYNNANFSTPPDGSAGRMQMYIFSGPTPDRDGDLDAEVILHEYTHGLSNRRVGGGVGISALQSGGMGEGWSDFYAMALLSEAGDDVDGVYASGGYASYQLSGLTQNYYFGIRRYPYCTDTNKNPLTFKDIDPAQASAHTGIPRNPVIGTTANEVHNMGEVWCMTLREVRANLVKKYGWAVGNQLVLQLVTDAMNLSPANPNFLQARDAILQADQVDNGGADLTELWLGFAKRGMGKSATSPASSTTTGVVEAFDIPYQPLCLVTKTAPTEGDGVLIGGGQVSLPSTVGTNVTVQLASSDTTELTVPASVMIPAGQTNVAFDLTVIDDDELDGTQPVTITATATGFATAYQNITVADNEVAALQVTLPVTATEGQGTVQGAVQISAIPAKNIIVNLSCSDTTEIQVPTTVTVPAGQTSAVFTATVIDDNQIDGPQTVIVTADVQNWIDGSTSITVLDNEGLSLKVNLPSNVYENAGTLTNAGTISISGTLADPLTVSLTSSNPVKLTVPATVTISPGQTNTTFNLTLVDNAVIDGHQSVSVTASAIGFTNGTGSIFVIDDESPVPPSNPRPGDLAVNVFANTNLNWNTGGFDITTNELILNGGFEAGLLANWTTVPSTYGTFVINNGAVNPPSPDGPLPPFAGAYSALGDESGPGVLYMYQTVSVPANASSVRLNWAHRIRNFYSAFSSSQQFQVRICDINNNVLATPFTTNPGDTLLQDWVQTNYDMTAFAGQTVRIEFWVNPGGYYFDVHVDNVSVQAVVPLASNSPGVTNDVYFGTNPTPGPGEFRGSTTNTSWPLPLLSPQTTYYWQICAHKGGTATGPVWRFTTAGVDHFAWSVISSPQYVGLPFNVTITAQDAFNTTVSNFNGAVALGAQSGSLGGSQLINFDDLSSSGLPVPGGYKSLVWSNFNYMAGSTSPNSGYAVGTVSAPNVAYNAYGTPANLSSTNPVNLVSAYLTAAWYDNLQIRVVGFAGRTMAYSNVYTLSATNPTLIKFNYQGVTSIDFTSFGGTAHPGYSGSGTHFVMDNVVMGLGTIPISIIPTDPQNLLNGIWHGDVTVQQLATNVTLRLDDGNGHTGLSNPFDVLLAVPPSILVQPADRTVLGGSNVTFTVAADGTAPLKYFWQKGDSPLICFTNPSFSLLNVTRTNSGTYSVTITNLFGAVTSSNATLLVHVPQHLGPPTVLPDGTFAFTSCDADGGTLSASDLTNLQAQASPNLIDWVTLPDALILSNGVLILDDCGSTNAPMRFYRIVETW